MIRVTSETSCEKVEAGQKEIILNGPPTDLRGWFVLANPQEEVLNIKSLPVLHGEELSKWAGKNDALRLSFRLNVGERKMVNVFHQLSTLTPPGTYESTVLVGKGRSPLKFIVQPHIEIDIQPSAFSFVDSSPGKVHSGIFTLTNLGNVPFQVPDLRHAAALDMDMICGAIGMAMRGKTKGDYQHILNDFSKNIQENLPDWARIEVVENCSILKPGESRPIHFSITLPKDCDPNKDYSGSMRFWDREISYQIKSHNLRKTKK